MEMCLQCPKKSTVLPDPLSPSLSLDMKVWLMRQRGRGFNSCCCPYFLFLKALVMLSVAPSSVLHFLELPFNVSFHTFPHSLKTVIIETVIYNSILPFGLRFGYDEQSE